MGNIEQQKQLYDEKNEFLSQYYEEVSPKEFYRELFPVGTFERKMIQEDQKPNGIIIEFCEGKEKTIAKREVVTDELDGFLKKRNGFTIYSPISYFGKARTGKNARFLYSLVFDLDGVEMKHLNDLLHQMNEGFLPRPTYLVNSGNGFHLYYHLASPLPMYPENQKYVRSVKRELTERIWNKYTSKFKNVQQQGILQGFRVVGTETKLGAEYPVKAFALHCEERWTIEDLENYLPDPRQKAIKLLNKKSKMSLEEAKRTYPEWYEQKVVQNLPSGRWNVSRNLYDWWLKKIKTETEVGHRYFTVMALAIYARKCNVEYEELSRDAFSLKKPFEKMTIDKTNHFTNSDIVAALEMYNEDYITFPRREIEKLTGIPMPENKRNGRKQSEHLEFLNYTNDFKRKKGEMKKTGRPSELETVKKWREKHPDGKKVECIRGTGLGKTTVYKYWK